MRGERTSDLRVGAKLKQLGIRPGLGDLESALDVTQERDVHEDRVDAIAEGSGSEGDGAALAGAVHRRPPHRGHRPPALRRSPLA